MANWLSGFEPKRTKHASLLQTWLRRLINSLEGKIIGYNVAIAHVWAEQQAALLQAGKRMPLEDSFIAATARRHNLTIATGTDKHFRGLGLKVFNPFKMLAEENA